MVETVATKITAKNAVTTIVLMVSIGNRLHLSNYTYPRLAAWASSQGYASLLIRERITNDSLAPHFQKLIAHRLAPGYKRYIIIDDDLMLKRDSPPMLDFDEDKIGLCKDPVQS